MRHSSRQQTERFHLLCLFQASLQRFALFFRLNAQGHVTCYADDSGNLAVLKKRLLTYLKHDPLPLLVAHFCLIWRAGRSLDESFFRILSDLGVDGIVCQEYRIMLHPLLRRIAGDSLHRLRDIAKNPVGIMPVNKVTRILKENALLFRQGRDLGSCCLQCLLRVLMLDDFVDQIGILHEEMADQTGNLAELACGRFQLLNRRRIVVRKRRRD